MRETEFAAGVRLSSLKAVSMKPKEVCTQRRGRERSRAVGLSRLLRRSITKFRARWDTLFELSSMATSFRHSVVILICFGKERREVAKKTHRKSAPADGERAAIGGYYPQYRLSANTILKSLRSETLEWIRLADPTAGRVDDFQIGTPGRVDGYQVKWSRNGGSFTFRDLTTPQGDKPPLIAQLTDGWRALRHNHPNRRVVVHLQTNEMPSNAKILSRAGEKSKASFAEFLSQAWYPVLDDGIAIPSEWRPVWDDLVKASAINAAEFTEFANHCNLEFGVFLPGQRRDDTTPDPDFERDLRQLTEYLQSVVADPSNLIELSRSLLLDRIGWTARLTYVSRHDFPEPTIPYRQIATTSDQLRVALHTLNHGYIVLLGDPGSGKSTLLTKTLMSLPYRIIRYYAFVPDSPDPQALRGEASSFFHDVTLSIDRAGFRTGKYINDIKDVTQLVRRFHDQLQLLNQDWRDTCCKTVILIDGLDHIPRELKPTNSLLKYLPHPDQVPEGVLVVLGSQTDQLAELPNSVHHSITNADRRIQISRLPRESVLEILEQANLSRALTSKQRNKVDELVAGHPLAIALLVNRLIDASGENSIDEILSSTAPFGGLIDEIYYGHWRQVIDDRHDDDLATLLGKLVRLRPAIDLEWIESWAGSPVVLRLRRSLYHLFRRESRHRWHIFHNSFRLFLLRRTAETPPDGFDVNCDRRLHSEIADLCAAEATTSRWNWEEGYHRKSACEHETVVALATAERLRAQLFAFRPIDAIQDDIRTAVASAGILSDFVAIVRLMFVGAEFTSRDETLSSASIHELLMAVGDVDKACHHVRDGRHLRLNAREACAFSLDLAGIGFDQEARLLFDLAEPIDVLKNPQSERELQMGQVDALLSWANAAISFRPLDDIVKLIRGTRNYCFHQDGEAGRSQKISELQNHLLAHVGRRLIDLQKWDDFELLFSELNESDLSGKYEQFWLCVHAWEACYGREDILRSKSFVTRASSLIELCETSDEEKERLAEGYLRVLGEAETSRELLSRVRPPKLTTNPGFGDRLAPYMHRLRYNRLRYTFGENRSASELIPDASDILNQGAVLFERGLSEIARIWALSWRGIYLNGPTFVHEVGLLLRLFCRNWNDDGRAHWSLLTRHRSQFYSLLVQAAQQHGNLAVKELASAFEREWFESDRSKYWPLDDIRGITKSFYHAGADKDWCHRVFERTEGNDTDDTDTSSRVTWRVSQAKCWIVIGELKRARSNLNQILKLSAGIGYRKDNQLDSWVEWMRMANRIDPEGSQGRINFLVSAVISMVQSTEGDAARTAAELLLESTFEWSPLRAVSLCRRFSESGVISYANGAAVIVKRALSNDAPTCQLCLSYCINLLIPISTSSNSDIPRDLIRRVGETQGNEAATLAANELLASVDIYALPETRLGWRCGIIDGLIDLGVPLDGFAIDLESEKDANDVSLIKLKLADGRELSRQELSGMIHSQDDLVSLIEAEAADSYWDWTESIRELADQMDANEVYTLAQRLMTRRREAIGIAVLSERLCELGDRRRAWNIGLRAVERANDYGWDKYYDGGTKQAAFRALLKIDPERGRALALESFVDYLIGDRWYPLNSAINLVEISSIICDDIPACEVWDIIERYLRALFSEAPLIESTVLDLDVGEFDEPQRALACLACEFLGHPAPMLSESAIRVCADLLLRGNQNIRASIFAVLENNDTRTKDLLIVLDAVSMADLTEILPFENRIGDLRRSPDQSIRWIANRLAKRLNLPPLLAQLTSGIETHYRGRVIVQETRRLYGASKKNSFDILDDSSDPRELVAPWLNDVEAIASGTGIDLDAVLVRVVEFMRELSPETTWNGAAEQALRYHMNQAKLDFFFQRPRSSQARRAIFYVLAELADGGKIPEAGLRIYEVLFRDYDTELVLRQPSVRPIEITPVVCPKYNEFETDWVKGVRDGGLQPICNAIGDRIVVGEHTRLKPAGDAMAIECRKSSLCKKTIEKPNATEDDSRFFRCVCCELVSTYHEARLEAEDCLTVLHLNYGYKTPGAAWLAFNPNLARLLNWAPSEKGFLAWERDGLLMAETIWWSDGSPHHSMPFYRKLEIGEGWLVVVTQKAVEQITDQLGPLTRVCEVTREIVKSKERFSQSRHFECN